MPDKEFSIQRMILSTHLWLGISGVICTWATFVLLQQAVSIRYLAFVLAGTMTVYTFHGYRNMKAQQRDQDIIPTVPAYIRLALIVGGIATMVLFLMLKRTNQLILLFPAVMALLYVVPIFKGRRLKDYPFIKILAIVVAWTMITYLIPVRSIPGWWNESGYNFLMLDRLLFFFALAIPFDIRDIQFDREHQLKTIPNTIGQDNSQNLALFSIFLAGGFMAMGTDALGIHEVVKIGILAVYILVGVVIIYLKNRPGNGFYSWLIDGFLFLYGIVILFLSR